jgi:hypothetical protein
VHKWLCVGRVHASKHEAPLGTACHPFAKSIALAAIPNFAVHNALGVHATPNRAPWRFIVALRWQKNPQEINFISRVSGLASHQWLVPILALFGTDINSVRSNHAAVLCGAAWCCLMS